jgi:hypothetical protein
MSNSTTSDWKVEFPRGTRSGWLGYYEGSRAISFEWELGGNDVVLIIYVGKPSEWSKQYPWAADRRQEIVERVGQEVIRQSAPNCKADIDVRDDGYTYLLIRKKPAA